MYQGSADSGKYREGTQANIEREQVLKYKLGKLEEQKDIYWR
jgi:hypothetical protein